LGACGTLGFLGWRVGRGEGKGFEKSFLKMALRVV